MKEIFYLCSTEQMVDVAQLVRALDCGSRGRGFKSHLPPKIKRRWLGATCVFFCLRCMLFIQKIPSSCEKYFLLWCRLFPVFWVSLSQKPTVFQKLFLLLRLFFWGYKH